jgi:DNA-binding NtrC family response regulator
MAWELNVSQISQGDVYMNPFQLLLIGAKISSDQKLISALTEGGTVQCRGVTSLQGWETSGGPVDLVLLEVDQLASAIHWLSAFHRIHPTIPVICLSETAARDAASLCFNAGAADFFRQPIHYRLIQEKVWTLLSLNR